MENSTPIIVAAGQFTQKDVHPSVALSPMDLAGEAARAALHDSGIERLLPSVIDTVAVVRLFSDSSNRPRLQHAFGRAENPPMAVSRRIGASPSTRIYGHLGGNTPQQLVNEMAQRIVAGDIDVVLLAGAEAIRTAQSALREGLELNWQEQDATSFEDRGLGEALTTPHEFNHGIGIPVQTYPLFENALRANRGKSIAAHQLAMARLFQPFTEVAHSNSYAFYGSAYTVEELATLTNDNRYIGFPYPKLMNARDGVNQGAALIMTSVGKAREMGIDPRKWIFLHGCGEAKDKLMHQRENYHSSPGIRLSTKKALDMAGVTTREISFFDLYSCFPSAVQIACDELGLAHNDPRGLTVTGGLPYFGGPGNNYSMHAIASMMPLLRAKPDSYALVTANGGWLSKHAAGVYSSKPTEGVWQCEAPASYQPGIDGIVSPLFTEMPAGRAAIETYTVYFGRSGPQRGIVVGRLIESGTRFIANTPVESGLLQSLVETEGIGRMGVVSSEQGANLFVPA